MIKIDPEYIDIFNKYWGLNTFTSMLSLLVLTHVIVFLTAFVVYIKRKDEYQNKKTRKDVQKIKLKLKDVTTYICAIVFLPLMLALPSRLEPYDGPFEILAKHQYQSKYDVKIQSDKREFEKEKEKLPEFNVTTLIKTSDGLYQAKLAEKPQETYGVKNTKLSINKIENLPHKKKEDCDNPLRCKVEKKNYTINAIELPTEKDKPIIVKIKIFEDEDLKGIYIVETNYEDLAYILENKYTAYYQQGSNNVYFE